MRQSLWKVVSLNPNSAEVIPAVPELGVADGHSASARLAHRESAQFWELLRRLVDQKPQSTRQGWEA